MAELWESVLLIIGAGIVGYIIRFIEERRRRTHEREVEYRKELKKNLPDLIEPLFKLLGDLWLSLIVLIDWEVDAEQLVSGRELTERLREVEQSLENLHNFVEEKDTKLDILLPHPLQSWQYTQIEVNVEDIINDIKSRKVKIDDIHEAIESILAMQSDLQKILGFETHLRLESEHAFAEHLSRFEKLKEKLKR